MTCPTKTLTSKLLPDPAENHDQDQETNPNKASVKNIENIFCKESKECLLCGSKNSPSKIAPAHKEIWTKNFMKLFQVQVCNNCHSSINNTNQIQRDTETETKTNEEETKYLLKLIKESSYCDSCCNQMRIIENVFEEIDKLQRQIHNFKLIYERNLADCIKLCQESVATNPESSKKPHTKTDNKGEQTGTGVSADAGVSPSDTYHETLEKRLKLYWFMKKNSDLQSVTSPRLPSSLSSSLPSPSLQATNNIEAATILSSASATPATSGIDLEDIDLQSPSHIEKIVKVDVICDVTHPHSDLKIGQDSALQDRQIVAELNPETDALPSSKTPVSLESTGQNQNPGSTSATIYTSALDLDPNPLDSPVENDTELKINKRTTATILRSVRKRKLSHQKKTEPVPVPKPGSGSPAVVAKKSKPKSKSKLNLSTERSLKTTPTATTTKTGAGSTNSRASQSLKRARKRKAKSDLAKSQQKSKPRSRNLKDNNRHGNQSEAENLLYVCPYADCTRKRKKYLSEFLRDVHVRKYHEGMKKKPYKCDSCSYMCQNKNLLTQHQNFHTGATPFACIEETAGRLCTEQFATYQRLVDHKRKKHQPLSFMCEQCGKSLTSRLGYKLHLETHSSRPRPKLQCELCGKTFAQQNSLNHHRRTNHDLTPEQIQSESLSHKCHFCEKVFVGKTRLKFHERIHTTQYRCSICNYGAAGKNALEDHVNTVHSLARPFQCPVCSHTFKVKRDLNRHQKTVHPASKDFMCSDCGKCFSNKRYLQDHEEIHKDVKSFLCPRCGKYFAQRTSLKVHIKSMHKNTQQQQPGSSRCRGDQDIDDPDPDQDQEQEDIDLDSRVVDESEDLNLISNPNNDIWNSNELQLEL